MSDINKIVLTGRVGQDPEIKQIGENTLATFSIGVNQYRGSKEQDTAWWRCQLWGSRAKVAEYIEVGMLLMVVGRVMVDTYEKDGEKKWAYYVDVDDLVLPAKPKGETSGERTQQRSSRSRSEPEPEPKTKAAPAARKRRTPF